MKTTVFDRKIEAKLKILFHGFDMDEKYPVYIHPMMIRNLVKFVISQTKKGLKNEIG